MRLVQALGFSNGCAELALKKPPPLVPSSLMISWLATGPIEIVCFAPSSVVASTAPASVCGTPRATKTQRADDGDRQQQVERDAGDIDPEIADRLRLRAREGAHQREGHREAGGRREEVMDREAEHLGEMTHRRLAAVVLPVGVGDEAHRGIEGEIGRHRIEAARVQRQKVLQPLNGVERQEPDDGEKQPSPSYRRASPARAPDRRPARR